MACALQQRHGEAASVHISVMLCTILQLKTFICAPFPSINHHHCQCLGDCSDKKLRRCHSKQRNAFFAFAFAFAFCTFCLFILSCKSCRHDLFGIFTRNWDESEETGNQNCSVEEDYQYAKRVCEHLSIPLYEADFIDQYWNRVFSHFVAQYSKGLTPNPDLECNRSIKFDALLKHAQGLGADRIATGHYARLAPGTDGKQTLPYCYLSHWF